jgi:hypothetical protein
MIAEYIGHVKSNSNSDGSFPKIYDDGIKLGVHGRTRDGDYYDVTIIGENPVYDPSRFGETEQGLLDKIENAAERSAENVKQGFGTKKGVIVVDGSILVTPLPGVEVISVQKEPLEM